MIKKLDKLRYKIVQLSRLSKKNNKTLIKLKHEIIKKKFWPDKS